jgi:hypothetical protein
MKTMKGSGGFELEFAPDGLFDLDPLAAIVI